MRMIGDSFIGIVQIVVRVNSNKIKYIKSTSRVHNPFTEMVIYND